MGSHWKLSHMTWQNKETHTTENWEEIDKEMSEAMCS